MRTCLISLCGGVLFSSVLAASSFDAVTGFSSSNPSGPWAYGTGTTGASFTAMTVFTNNNCNGIAGLSCWQPPSTSSGVPVVELNQTSTTINYSTALAPPGVLVVHPGPSVDTIVEWTAPTAGTYTIAGFFELLDVSPSGITGLVYDGSTQLYSSTLTGPGASHPSTPGGIENFSFVETLAAGTVISFGVNNDGNYLFDSTGFDATITSAPEPGIFVLCAVGLGGLFALRKARN